MDYDGCVSKTSARLFSSTPLPFGLSTKSTFGWSVFWTGPKSVCYLFLHTVKRRATVVAYSFAHSSFVQFLHYFSFAFFLLFFFAFRETCAITLHLIPTRKNASARKEDGHLPLGRLVFFFFWSPRGVRPRARAKASLVKLSVCVWNSYHSRSPYLLLS